MSMTFTLPPEVIDQIVERVAALVLQRTAATGADRPECLSVKDAAEYMGCTEGRVRKLIERRHRSRRYDDEAALNPGWFASQPGGRIPAPCRGSRRQPPEVRSATRETKLNAVEIRGLVKQYDAHAPRAVDGIDLDIADGELFGLLGPNGAGKTTTVGVATTRVRATSGTVQVAGADAVHDPVAVKRVIGVVTQFNTLDRACSVRENLIYHCRYFGIGAAEARVRADELLATFALAERRDAGVSELSGGMVQRLQIARAIAHRPRVLFLDEPTAGLDPQSRLALWSVLTDLRTREGITILLTTHHMEEAEAMCDRLAIMDGGRILVTGTPGELKRSVGVDTIVEIHVDTMDEALRNALAALPGVNTVEPTDGGARIFASSTDGLMARVVEQAAGHGLRDVSLTEPTLETVFITLTGRGLRE